MAVKEGDDGIIYGVGKVSWNGHELGWISQEGINPAGKAPEYVEIYAAQVRTGPVKRIQSSPGTTAFSFKLIQLKPDKLKEVFGGKTDDSGTGKYTSPKTVSQEKGLFHVETLSGHTLDLKNTRIDGVLSGALNTNGTLSYDCTVTGEIVSSDEDGNLEITPPQQG